MIAALVLAAAVVTDDDGCRWLRRDVKAAPAATHAASAPVRHVTGKRRHLLTMPGYDPLDCGEGGSALPPIALETFTPVPEIALEEPAAPEVPVVSNPAAVPVTFAEGTGDVGAPVFWSAPPIGGGPCCVAPPLAPVPEPSVLWLLAAGLAALFYKRREA